MKKDVQRIALAVLVMAFGMALAACQQATPTGGGTQQSAAPEGMKSISKTVVLDPTQAEDDESKNIDDYIFEPLVSTKDGKVTTWLATSWTVAEDNLAYTFELRTDTKFSDGKPFNADAVVAIFTRWFDPKDPNHGTGAYKAWLDTFGGFKGETDSDGKKKSAFDGAEKTGDYTVVLHLNRPVDNLPEKLASTNFDMAKLSEDGKSLVGTGPYMVGAKTDQHLVLVVNPNYTGPLPATGDLEFPFK